MKKSERRLKESKQKSLQVTKINKSQIKIVIFN